MREQERSDSTVRLLFFGLLVFCFAGVVLVSGRGAIWFVCVVAVVVLLSVVVVLLLLLLLLLPLLWRLLRSAAVAAQLLRR